MSAMSGSRRAWKFQDFVAHGQEVNCLALGHTSGRVMVTGGEDKKVNMWAVGNSNCIMSLSGHTTPIEAVVFNENESLVLAGSRSGALKIWNLEAAKILRTLTGHKANIRSLDFHPLEGYAASGSLDCNVKLWDVRRKACVCTYKGHTGAVTALKFSPDGKWVASGGEDNTIKIWDLRQGRMISEMKDHAGCVNGFSFHPHEVLMASASSDRTVKFWELDTFKLFGTSDPDSTAVKCVFFHPEEQCLLGGSQDLLKINHWEPVQTLECVQAGWGKVADMALAPHDQLVGASFYQSNVQVHIVDLKKCNKSPQCPIQQQPVVPSNNNFPIRRSYEHGYEASKQAAPQRFQPHEEPCDDTSVGDEDDDSMSIADIQQVDDYNEIFRPRRATTRTPQGSPERQQEEPSPPMPVVVEAPSTSVGPPQPPAPVSRRGGPSEAGGRSRPGRKRPTAQNVASSASTATSTTSATTTSAAPHNPLPKHLAAPSAPSPALPVEHSHPPRVQVSQPVAGNSGGDCVLDTAPEPHVIAVDDFMPDPKNANLSEEGANKAIFGQASTISFIYADRLKKFEVVMRMINQSKVKVAVEEAIRLEDKSVLVDLISAIKNKPSDWNLELAAILLPAIEDIIISKYEYHVKISCNAVKLVLRNFGSVIKSNVCGPPSIGVDISREERYHKCKTCYETLMSIKGKIEHRVGAADKNSSLYRQVMVLMGTLG